MTEPMSEWEVLTRLRNRPELFEEIAAFDGDEFRLQTVLRARYPEAVVRAALTLADLRERAAVKFSHAHRMWFDRVGLEQATGENIAQHKANRFARLGHETPIWDLCCGIGGDAIALSTRHPVAIVDRSPLAITRAAWNVAVHTPNHPVRSICATVESLGLADAVLHIDPDRRPGGKRSRRIEAMQPDLETVRQLMADNRAGAVKLSPAANFGGQFTDCEIELTSHAGECREATVWFGELITSAENITPAEAPSDAEFSSGGGLGGEPIFRATVLPGDPNEPTSSVIGYPLDYLADVSEPGGYLYDPDPAVVRAGLVDLIAEQHNLRRLDDAEEYLTADELIRTPFATPFRIREIIPHREKDLRRYFRSRSVGTLEIKCRHLRTDADALRKRIPLKGSDRVTLVLAKLAGKASGLICERIGGST